ncbi:MAG: hypothetical protein GWP10_04415 [Nitrospiraceae bacterium]|nr:hypothetical protein [Nitrospiraceae bacterium]
MKRLYLVLFTIVIWIALSSISEAASQRGKVTAVVKNDTEICEVLKNLVPDSKKGTCTVKGQVSNLVVIKGTLPKRIKAGQSVILKIRGIDKVVAKVVLCVRSDSKIDDAALAILKKKGDCIWYNKKGESYLVLKTQKVFLPSVGNRISLKTKSARREIEGC